MTHKYINYKVQVICIKLDRDPFQNASQPILIVTYNIRLILEITFSRVNISLLEQNLENKYVAIHLVFLKEKL